MKIFLTALLLVSVIVEPKKFIVEKDRFKTNATEFYFVRHGQTDHNAGKIPVEQYGDIPLNSVGQGQAIVLQGFIETLPIQTICCSPLLRARQTKDVVNKNLNLSVVMISDLREGSHNDWCEIQRIKNRRDVTTSKPFKMFEARLRAGLYKALLQSAPVLIIAHGGVYSVICRILNINTDSWVIANCSLVRFYKKSSGFWAVEHIFDVGISSKYNINHSILNDCQNCKKSLSY